MGRCPAADPVANNGPYPRKAAVCTGASHRRVNSWSSRVSVIEQPAGAKCVRRTSGGQSFSRVSAIRRATNSLMASMTSSRRSGSSKAGISIVTVRAPSSPALSDRDGAECADRIGLQERALLLVREMADAEDRLDMLRRQRHAQVGIGDLRDETLVCSERATRNRWTGGRDSGSDGQTQPLPDRRLDAEPGIG